MAALARLMGPLRRSKIQISSERRSVGRSVGESSSKAIEVLPLSVAVVLLTRMERVTVMKMSQSMTPTRLSLSESVIAIETTCSASEAQW